MSLRIPIIAVGKIDSCALDAGRKVDAAQQVSHRVLADLEVRLDVGALATASPLFFRQVQLDKMGVVVAQEARLHAAQVPLPGGGGEPRCKLSFARPRLRCRRPSG